MRILMLCGALAVLTTGCHMMPMKMSPEEMAAMMQPPEVPEQMKTLEKFVGTWDSSGESVAIPDEMKAMMVDADGNVMDKVTMNATVTSSWALDGMFLKQVGRHEMPDGTQVMFEEFINWDDRAGKFHATWFSSTGESGHGWMSFSDDGRSCTVQYRGKTLHGMKKSWSGVFNFEDDTTATWTFTDHTPMGPMTMKGTNKKK